MTGKLSVNSRNYILYGNILIDPPKIAFPRNDPKNGWKQDSNKTLLQRCKSNTHHASLGFYNWYGWFGALLSSLDKFLDRYEPKPPIFGPKMGPKYHFAVITAHKRAQTNENHIWIGFCNELWHIGTIFIT